MSWLTAWVMLFYCTFCITVRALDSENHKCGAIHGHRMRRSGHELFPHRPPSGNKYGHSLQFENGQSIQYLKLRNPSGKFSVAFWMKPEGGQHNPAVILRAHEKCAPENSSRGWAIGLREADVTSDLRITFTVHSASSDSNTSIRSHSKIEPGRWYHVVATYDEFKMKLYVNQAKVAVGYGQKGTIFDSTTTNVCDVLEVGGDVKRGLYYRGEIDKLRLWNVAISHPKVTQSLPENSIDSDPSQVVMYDDFNDSILKNNNWIPVTDQYPRFVRSTVPEDKHDLSIRKPPCGKTICDNPEVIRSYLAHPDSRGSKHLRIRFINVMDDDGRRPMLTESEINSQFNLMQSAFSVYNISWEKKVESVRNSWLRNKIVLHDIECKVAMIGDNRHDQSCCLEITGWDGGDCKRTECPPQKTRNGVCDPECNTARNQYDGGECCKSPLSTTCIDPKSPNRRYFSIDEYKKAVGITNRDYLNVYIVNWTDENLQGTSVFPWEKTIHTELGGVVLPPKNFGTTKVLIHEIGHVLGLWHVHHGSTTEMLCSDACFESFPSLELGDLCSDTNPTIKHTTCGDPVVTTQDSCGLTQHTNTPYSNYMGYANDSCLNHFTPEQVARMHCYIDLDYQSWQTNAKPSFVPLSPRIIEAKTGSIKLSWLPPLGPGENSAINLCNECDHEHMLEQYATTAYSPVKNWPDGSKAAHEATGMPDADHCNASPYSWRPPEDTHLICQECPLYLEVGFKQAVVPNGITIWVPYSNMLLEGSEMIDAFKDILLVYIDGSTESIGNGTAQCDSPFTKPLYVSKKVSSVRIYISHVAVSIDAVKLTSVIGHPNCSECKPLRYVIQRDPPFNSGQEIRVQTARFEDTDIDITGRYEYKVRAETYDNVAGPFSPPLIYEAKHGFCGDGVIDEGENCDDGNVRDGDGCNIQCQMEDVFRCDGRPSLCYRHDGDGVCEEFEKRTSIKDCGFYTPEGFKDQWVNSVVANPQHIYLCPPEVIIGPPRSDLKCEFGDHALDAHMKCDNGWTPSNEDESTKNLWLKAYFKTPTIASALVVYFASIVPDLFEPEPVPFIKFELHGGRPTQKTTLEYRVTKACNENPITIPIHHDMTKPFFRTQYVKILFHEDLKIAAVALRSPKYFDPVGLQHCTGSQLFHPGTQKCRTYDCSMPTCAKLMLKHSTLTKGKCKKGSLEGSTCMAQCDQGFTPVSPFEIMCSGGEWLVDGETPRCTPVKCGKPKIANAQIHCPDGTTFGKKCVYKCEEGTKPAGAGTELSVTCEADGTWSATTTFCRKTCLPPPTPLDSKLLPISKDCMKGKPFNLGDSCKYRCKQGYRPSGKHNRELNRKGHFIQRCLKDGTWSSKRCVQITCPVRNRKIFEWYNCTLGNMMGSVCRLTCPGEKVHEIRCGSDGRWDKKFQFCATIGTCDVPTTVNNVLKFDNCGTKSRPGDKCGVRCTEPGSKAVVQGGRPEELTSIMCSPFLQWYPNLNEVICIALCDNDTIGDGNCDAINNNIACRFDGGDCCDPIACGEDCDCKDIMSRYYGSGDYYPSS